MLPLQCIMRLLVMLRHTTFITHYSYIGMLYSSYVHLLKVVFGVESAHEIYMYTPASTIPVTKKANILLIKS